MLSLLSELISIHHYSIVCLFPHLLHLFNLQQIYKADYEDIKTRCFFPQTITPEYEAIKKLGDCKDVSTIYIFKIIYIILIFCHFSGMLIFYILFG